MSYHRCAVAQCCQTASHRCARCDQPFCDGHASWQQIAVVQDQWARWTTLQFLCATCVPRDTDVNDNLPTRWVQAGPGAANRPSR